MRLLRSLQALSGADRRLFVSALLAMVTMRLALRAVDIARLRRWAARRGNGTRPVRRVLWAAQAARRRVPGATCLVYALALQRLLSRNGHESELHIGVTKQDGAFVAHAWVECEGEVLDGEGGDDAYTRLIAWRAAGQH
jgi:Transglutaminase-like superfamily